MQKTYKKLKPWHGIIVLVLSAIEIFWVSGYFSKAAGLYGTLASEFLLLVIALFVVFIARADFNAVFPMKSITVAGVAGTSLLWLGSFMIMMIVDLIIMAFFPEQMSATSTGLNAAFSSVPFQVALTIVAISPAICEEAVFRGVFIHSLNPIKNKWIVILISGLIFGAFHGSIWRFVPTAFLGMVMGYILFETDNMIYNGIFHCINNAVPIVLLFLMKGNLNSASADASALAATGAVWISVGAYCMLGAVIPFSLYGGNYLIHYKQPGYRTSFIPEGKNWILGVLIVSTVAFAVIGVMIMVLAIMMQPDMMNEIMKQAGV